MADSVQTSAIGGTEVAIGTAVDNRSVFDVELKPEPQELTPRGLRQELEHQLAISADPHDEPGKELTLNDLRAKTDRFVYWGQLINTAQGMADPEMNALAKQLKAKLIGRQLEEFPLIRKQYAEIVERNLSRSNIIVEVQGSRSDEICFIATVFKDSKYVRSFHMEVAGLLRAFRFREARYFIQPGVETDHHKPGSQPDTEVLEHLG